MVKETGQFIVNLAAKNNEEAFNYLGSYSGRDENKLETLDLNYEDGTEVDAPVLLDFPVNIECEVVDSIKTGSHEMFVGKILHIHADEELVNADGEINYFDIDYK